MRSFFTAAAVALASVAAAPARDDADNDPGYVTAVTRMEEAIRGLPSYRVDVVFAWKAEDGTAGSNAFTFIHARPGKFRLEVRPGGKPDVSLLVVGDGKIVTTYLASRKLYTQVPGDDPAEVIESTPLLAMSLKGTLIDSLTRPGMKNFILARSSAARRVGEEAIDGRKIDRFHLTWGQDDEDFWIGPEAQPLPRKLVRIYSNPGQDKAAPRFTTTTTLAWTVGKPIDPAAFTIELPKDARKVDDLDAAGD